MINSETNNTKQKHISWWLVWFLATTAHRHMIYQTRFLKATPHFQRLHRVFTWTTAEVGAVKGGGGVLRQHCELGIVNLWWMSGCKESLNSVIVHCSFLYSIFEHLTFKENMWWYNFIIGVEMKAFMYRVLKCQCLMALHTKSNDVR